MKRNAVDHMGAATKPKDFYCEGECMENEAEIVYTYSPEQRYDKALSYIKQYFGQDFIQSIPALCRKQRIKFSFSELTNVYYIISSGKLREHAMMIVGANATIIAHGDGKIGISPNKFWYDHLGGIWACTK